MLYLAIDQHSKQLTVNVRDEAGQIVLRKQVSTRGEAPREFLTQLAQRAGADGYVTIVEVCGFNDWLLDLLPHCGCRETVLVQPGEPGKRKTDRRDANHLGEVLWVNRHRLLARQRVQGLRRVNIPGVRERDDRRLAALRHRVGRELTRVINRVWTLLRRRNLQQDCPTKTIQSKKARAWLTALIVSPLDRLELDQLLARWQLLAEHRSVLEATIAGRVAQCPDAQLLTTLPSAGCFMALGLSGACGRYYSLSATAELGELLGIDAIVPEFRREKPTARLDQQRRQQLGSLPARTTGDARPQARRTAASLVSGNQAPAWCEDRSCGRDAPTDHDHLAHAHASRGVSSRRRQTRGGQRLMAIPRGEGTSRTPSSLPPAPPHPLTPFPSSLFRMKENARIQRQTTGDPNALPPRRTETRPRRAVRGGPWCAKHVNLMRTPPVVGTVAQTTGVRSTRAEEPDAAPARFTKGWIGERSADRHKNDPREPAKTRP